MESVKKKQFKTNSILTRTENDKYVCISYYKKIVRKWDIWYEWKRNYEEITKNGIRIKWWLN
jgi:hypothetical protein